MIMETVLLSILALVSLLLIPAILLQQMSSGMGGAWGMGGSGGGGGSYQTRRGAEKFLYRSTIALIVIFIVSSITYLLVMNQ
jgi:preprotein translocase subunit SecG